MLNRILKDYRFWMASTFVLTLLMVGSVIHISYDNKNYVTKLQNNFVEYKIKYEKCRDVLQTLKNTNDKKTYYENVTITAYSPSVEETDSDPENTAIMENPVVGRTCAVSRDMVHLLGKRIYIHGVGVFEVNDLMNKRYDKRVDICLNKGSAIKFGIKNTDIVVID